jgi:hypothetical protein
MKKMNVHVLPTANQSRFFKDDLGYYFSFETLQRSNFTNQHIYITSDEGIREDCWIIPIDGVPYKLDSECSLESDRKIILTTDQDLIKDGVQAIDDEFLEWFVKNPSCEYVKITKDKIRQDKEFNDISHWDIYEYKISIPQEEPKFISGQFFLERADEVIVIHRPKQETLEEVAERLLRDHRDFETEGDSSYQNGRLNGILEGLKYQAERMYSEEDMKLSFEAGKKGYMRGSMLHQEYYFTWKNFKQWFEQFKKR